MQPTASKTLTRMRRVKEMTMKITRLTVLLASSLALIQSVVFINAGAVASGNAVELRNAQAQNDWASFTFGLARSLTTTPLAAPAPLVTFVVTNTNDTGDGSLRKAITDANSSPGFDEIAFNIPGVGPHTISPASALPDITGPVTINGYTQPGASANTLATGNDAVLLIELDGTNSGSGATNGNGLAFAASDSTVRGLVINRFNRAGIAVRSGSGNIFAGNFIGTNPAGTASLPNGSGIYLENSATNTIGGAAPADRNVILGGANPAIFSAETGAGGNTIQGNYIGMNAAGTAALNSGRIVIQTANNLIGGTSPGAGNLIGKELELGLESIAPL